MILGRVQNKLYCLAKLCLFLDLPSEHHWSRSSCARKSGRFPVPAGKQCSPEFSLFQAPWLGTSEKKGEREKQWGPSKARSQEKHWDSRETKLTVSQGTSYKWFVIEQTKTNANFDGIPATTSGHLQLQALIACNGGQHFAGKVNCFPFNVLAFSSLPALGIWQ